MTTGVSRRVKEGPGPIALGSTLERKYELREVLGQGHTGVVYLAYDRSLERDVSVKVLRPSYAANQEVASYFRQEAVALARVRHENVVQIFTFGEHQGLPYFVMEYLPGGTVARLQSEAGEQGLSLDAALSILDQVCQGLQAVHDSGIVHRDIKPANMLISAPFRVAVADFGLVRTTDRSGATPDIIGTPLYVAPELIEGQELSEGLLNRCDIYSLGVSAFELLTGRCPFEGDTIQQLFEAHLDQPAPRASHVNVDLPETFDPVLHRAMSKAPERRQESCTELLRELNAARARGSGRINSKILVVGADDSQQLELSLALTLGASDVLMETSPSGEEALERIGTGARPDLVLINDAIEGMSAFELAACLRGDETTSAIPIILLSRPLASRSRRLLRDMGVEVLELPIEPGYLAKQVSRCLNTPGASERHKATIVTG